MSGKKINVLLVEGDADETSIVKRHLGDTDGSTDSFEIKEAARISTACHELAREEFDVVILDLKVPNNVGIEGFNRIRAQLPEMPVVLLSGLQDEALAAQAVKRGAQDYLIKGTMDCCSLKRVLRHAIEKKKLASLVENLLRKDSTAKLVVNGAAVILYANPAAEVLFGVPATELTGKSFPYPGEPAAAVVDSAPAAEFPTEVSVLAVDWNGEPARLITFMDGRKKPRAKSVTAEDRRLDGIKAEFTRRLSHELRNTQATVKTALFCLLEPKTGALSARQMRLVEMVARNLDRQIHVFEKIEDVARFEGGKLNFNFRRVEISALVDELSREFRSSGLVVQSAGPFPSIAGDADLILQVFRHLLDNAFRYAKENVVLKAMVDETDGVRIVISNDGVGIPKNRLGDLFTPFSRLDQRKGAIGFKGGLGLTMCHEIIAGHKGRIWAESDETGSRFTFTLPCYALPADGNHGMTLHEGALLADG